MNEYPEILDLYIFSDNDNVYVYTCSIYTCTLAYKYHNMNKCTPRTFIKLEGQLNLPEESPIKMGGRAYFKRTISKLVGALVVPIIVGGGLIQCVVSVYAKSTYHKARETKTRS